MAHNSKALIHHCPDKTRATAAVELFESWPEAENNPTQQTTQAKSKASPIQQTTQTNQLNKQPNSTNNPNPKSNRNPLHRIWPIGTLGPGSRWLSLSIRATWLGSWTHRGLSMGWCTTNIQNQWGGFRYVLFYPLPREMIQFDEYFSDELEKEWFLTERMILFLVLHFATLMCDQGWCYPWVVAMEWWMVCFLELRGGFRNKWHHIDRWCMVL